MAAFHRPGNEFPQQVSADQASEDRSEIAFSNGASFPSHVNGYSMNSETYYVRDGFSNPPERDPARLPSPHYGVTGATLGLTHQARHPMYADYGERLRSFARWTRTNPDPVCLCDAGFFFTNEGDLVRCFSCGIGLKDFTDRDDPLREHVRHSGNCLYLLEHLGTETLASIKASCQEQQRIQGSVEDLVRCFSCDGGLKRWDAEDVPWTEHCRWFPTCPYARERKGEDFIALVLASSAYNQEGPTNNEESVGSEDLQGAMDQMTLRDPVLRAALEEHKTTCLEMGYDIADVNEAVDDLRNMGTITPTIEELIDMVEVVKERKQSKEIARQLEKRQQETPLEENQRLKSFDTCMTCGKNNVNCLFLPCTHHRVCMECATLFTQCPVCDRQKIRTYLV
ncbi:inhibitor of apoptosis protein-like isoform X3 [Ruditapes philippinarum]|uniref:inhibitor of apoptosis protein-like isoform X3 n=1 Tax=Ruditapes philippinarum TaxID=129788 RepID=UPI00295A8862|nr:inhibitor of apoptosis protein-like isoform X3 [Ruditapes philippinarum]